MFSLGTTTLRSAGGRISFPVLSLISYFLSDIMAENGETWIWKFRHEDLNWSKIASKFSEASIVGLIESEVTISSVYSVI